LLQRPGKQQPPFDAVLKRGLDGRRHPGGDECPDDATLAAYCERALPAPQSAHWEEHFSSCARCQGALAAIARARTPDRSIARRRTSRRWEVYAALAAGVAGISIVATLMRSRPHSFSADSLTRNDTAISAQAYKQTQEETEAPAQVKDSRAMIALNQPAQAPGPPAQPRSAGEPAPGEKMMSFGAIGTAPRHLLAGSPGRPERHKQVAEARESADKAATLGGFAAKSSPGAGAGSPEQLANAQANREAEAEPAAPPPPALLAERENAAALPGGLKSIPGPRAPAACCAPAAVSMAKPREPPLRVSIRTADGVERWRLGGNGMIEHLASEDEWTRQESGVTADLTAGAAPSSSVCWAVGAGGTVLRTTDGEHWQKLASPTSADLAAVSAQDADSATVTSADGERFATTDGGRAWRPL
jgi:hypothetical protein